MSMATALNVACCHARLAALVAALSWLAACAASAQQHGQGGIPSLQQQHGQPASSSVGVLDGGRTWDVILSPEEAFGTHHFEIPGVLHAENGTAYSFIAHCFLRAVASGGGGSSSSDSSSNGPDTSGTSSSRGSSDGVAVPQRPAGEGAGGEEGLVHVRGFAYFEQANALAYWRGRLISQGPAITQVPLPRLELWPAQEGAAAAAGGSSAGEGGAGGGAGKGGPAAGAGTPDGLPTGGLQFGVAASAAPERPLHFELSAPPGALRRQRWLAVRAGGNGGAPWPRAAPLDGTELAACAPPASDYNDQVTAALSSRRRFYFVSFPLWGMDPGQQAYMASISARWHAALGFDALLLYTYDESPYVRDPGCAGLLASGQLRLVSWAHGDTGLARPPDAGRDRCFVGCFKGVIWWDRGVTSGPRLTNFPVWDGGDHGHHNL